MDIDGIKQQLDKRFMEDQNLSKKKEWAMANRIAKINSDWLKKVIKEYGWPSSDIVGTYGEQAAWLIAQHSPDLEFQKTCPKLLKNSPKTKEREQHIAYLMDRILVSSGKKQVYGTQFNGSEQFPIKDVKNLDKRRKSIGLDSFEDYKKIFTKRQ
jgi:hypothetical protein